MRTAYPYDMDHLAAGLVEMKPGDSFQVDCPAIGLHSNGEVCVSGIFQGERVYVPLEYFWFGFLEASVSGDPGGSEQTLSGALH